MHYEIHDEVSKNYKVHNYSFINKFFRIYFSTDLFIMFIFPLLLMFGIKLKFPIGCFFSSLIRKVVGKGEKVVEKGKYEG